MLPPTPSVMFHHPFARAMGLGVCVWVLGACASWGARPGPGAPLPAPPAAVEAAFHPAHVGAFFEPLSQHGSWRSDRGHWIWRPSDPSFAPFTAGTWTLTEHGPTWVSGSPFGWAVEHYGVWRHSSRGWEWRPDTRWAPARVTWRLAADAVGWAPEIDPIARRDIAPEMLWRFVDAEAFFSSLSSRGPAVAAPRPPPLHDVRHNPWFVTHSRTLPRWEFNRAGRLVARGVAPLAPTTPVAALDPQRTRWHGRSVRQQVAGRLSDGPRGPRAAPDDSDRRGRAPPATVESPQRRR